MEMEYDRAAKEIDGAATWLLSQSFSNGSSFGCVGYCMGGGLVLTTSIRNNNVGAAIVYYGGLPNPPENLKDINAPVLAFYGSGEGERANQLNDILNYKIDYCRFVMQHLCLIESILNYLLNVVSTQTTHL